MSHTYRVFVGGREAGMESLRWELIVLLQRCEGSEHRGVLLLFYNKMQIKACRNQPGESKQQPPHLESHSQKDSITVTRGNNLAADLNAFLACFAGK